MSKILVTGGKGFIGSKLIERLSKDNQVESFDVVDGQDLRKLEQVCKAVKGKDAVFHLAAVADLNWARVHPIETMEINIRGTWNVAYACSKFNAKLNFASTMCTYGNQKVHPSTELSLPNPSEIYACSKLAGESIIKGFYYTYGLQYNMMRFATIYGEGTRPALGTHIFLRQALTNKPITIHGDGNQTRTLTYITDLIDAIEALYKSGKFNQIWNLTSEEEVSANQMAESIKEITKSRSEIIHIPQRIGQTHKEQVSARKMFNEVGWKAKVDWNEGIRKMYEWFIKTNQVNNVYVEPK
jgi:nucleoside-diphosphate-sugar epimerase